MFITESLFWLQPTMKVGLIQINQSDGMFQGLHYRDKETFGFQYL